MYIARLEHIATGYPHQVQISFFEYLMYKIMPETLVRSLESQLGMEFELDYFFEGVTYVK
jgi:hypothetical protein